MTAWEPACLPRVGGLHLSNLAGGPYYEEDRAESLLLVGPDTDLGGRS